jgi:nicotinamide riboside kinase
MEENFKQLPSSIIKIAMYGPESTGKTTLSKQLAKHYNDEWIPEFARDYLQEKWDNTKEICVEEDLIPIAIGQIKLENEAVLKAKKFLFCDTNLLVTKVFSDIYYNHCDAALEQAAKEHNYDLIFLTNIDVPWKADDLRDSPNNREIIFEKFENAIIKNGNPYLILEGNEENRFKKAVKIIDELVLAKQLGFSSSDFISIYTRNISIKTIQKQLQFFKDGIAKANLVRSAIKSDGICVFSKEEIENYIRYFDENKQHFDIQKFVPASGAASRMFKFLSEFINEFDPETDTINSYINHKKCTELSVFLVGLKSFPFYNTLREKTIEIYPNYLEKEREERYYLLIKTLLSKDYFDYANKPKGILPFHQNEDTIFSPIDEHIKESVFYELPNITTKIHFTVSPEHKISFEEITNKYNHVEVTFSFQQEITDTLAVNNDNSPFRNAAGELVFRPGGHGALIENLNQLAAEIVFIKNIDNVSQNHLIDIVNYKKLLGGILFKMQQQLFSFLNALESDVISIEKVNEIKEFTQKQLHVILPNDFEMYKKSFQIQYLFNELNRPIRVCGMVRNEGEPGGGPFWIKDEKGKISLQIIETSQIDLTNEKQVQIVNEATHFNPVDLVCGVKNYKGEKFDLAQFVDENTGFIVSKNKNGKPYKAYELPGLWNGAMANWITLFVEVPLITFNPVKTVNDLLKPAHQPENNG